MLKQGEDIAGLLPPLDLELLSAFELDSEEMVKECKEDMPEFPYIYKKGTVFEKKVTLVKQPETPQLGEELCFETEAERNLRASNAETLCQLAKILASPQQNGFFTRPRNLSLSCRSVAITVDKQQPPLVLSPSQKM